MTLDPGTLTVGRTGVSLPRIVLGTATFGLQCDEPTSRTILDRAVSEGLSWLDTSTSYPLGSGPDAIGVTESLLGRWLDGRRDSVFLATKVYNRTGPAPWQIGLSRKHILDAVDGSLRRLQTDYIDLLQFHRFDASCPLEETLAAVDLLVKSGKVRYIGTCNFFAYQIAQALSLSEFRSYPRVQTAQVRYSLIRRGPEVELLRLLDEEKVSALAFNVLAGGVLTGKYSSDVRPEAGRFATGEAGERYTKRFWTEDVFATVDAMRPIVARAETTLAALATAWALRRREVSAVIVGVSRASQLDTVNDALSLQLTDETWAEVDKITRAHRQQVEELSFESS